MLCQLPLNLIIIQYTYIENLQFFTLGKWDRLNTIQKNGSFSQEVYNLGEKNNQRCPQQVWTSLVAQTVKRLSTICEIRVQALGWEDPLEKEMAIHSSTIAWKIPWTEEPGRLQSMGLQRVEYD